MHFLSPACVNEAPVHAAVLARLCAGSDAAVVGTAAVGLAEQSAWNVQEHAAMLAWLETGASPPPTASIAQTDDERLSVNRLREALGSSGLVVPALEHDLGRTPALLATLHACGVRRAYAIETVWVIARLASAVSEAMTNKRRAFLHYPMLLPEFRYEDE